MPQSPGGLKKWRAIHQGDDWEVLLSPHPAPLLPTLLAVWPSNGKPSEVLFHKVPASLPWKQLLTAISDQTTEKSIGRKTEILTRLAKYEIAIFVGDKTVKHQ